jgi:hypothetical protein
MPIDQFLRRSEPISQREGSFGVDCLAALSELP